MLTVEEIFPLTERVQFERLEAIERSFFKLCREPEAPATEFLESYSRAAFGFVSTPYAYMTGA